MERKHKVATFTLSMAVAFSGATALSYLNSSSIEFVTEDENHTIGGEHPTMIAVTGDERKVIPSTESIQFSIQNHFSSPAQVSYSLLLTNEEGQELLSMPASAVTTIAAGEAASYPLSGHGYLEDGLYTYQITAAGSADGQLADSGMELNFAVLNDSFYMLTNEEWFSMSLANGAGAPTE